MDERGAHTQKIWPSINVAGVDIDCVDFSDTLTQIRVWVDAHRSGHTQQCRQISTINPEFIVDAHRDSAFADILAQVDLRVPDGIGVLWAANINGAALRERVTGSDGIERIGQAAALNGWRVFFLGAAPGVAAQTADQLRKRYPSLIVSGIHSGSPAPTDWPAIHEYLSATSPDILFVAYGHPSQDIWIRNHVHELPAAVAIGVGGAFDFVAGITQRAPTWMQRWASNGCIACCREPWRWRRMMKLPVFVGLVVARMGTGKGD